MEKFTNDDISFYTLYKYLIGTKISKEPQVVGYWIGFEKDEIEISYHDVIKFSKPNSLMKRFSEVLTWLNENVVIFTPEEYVDILYKYLKSNIDDNFVIMDYVIKEHFNEIVIHYKKELYESLFTTVISLESFSRFIDEYSLQIIKNNRN